MSVLTIKDILLCAVESVKKKWMQSEIPLSDEEVDEIIQSIRKDCSNLGGESFDAVLDSLEIVNEDGVYVVTDTMSGVASQGKSMGEALSNLREALELYNSPESEA